MRSMVAGALTLVVAAVMTNVGRADDRAQALEFLDKAIKATGGEEKLKKSLTANVTGKGNVHAMGMVIGFTFQGSFISPNKSRTELEIDINGMKIQIINVHNGTMGWVSTMGTVIEMTDDQVKDASEQAHGRWVETLVPLKDKAFTLNLLGEAQIDGKPAQGLRVSYKDRPDISLYFDKQSHLLVKHETRGRNPFTMQEALQETFYSEFKESNGIKQANKFKILMDGVLFMDGEDFEYKPVDKLDDALFGKPN